MTINPIDSAGQPKRPARPFIFIGVFAVFILLIAGFAVFGRGLVADVLNNYSPNTQPLQAGHSKQDSITQESAFGKLSSNSQLNSGTSNPSETNLGDEIDTDGDGIPDWVETGAGLDPNKDECVGKLLECSATLKDLQKQIKNALIILDSSGSMAERMSDGSVKMDVAKEEINKMVETLPQGVNLAFMVYGSHGSNAGKDKAVSCAGIDVLYPLGEADKTKISQTMTSFSPTGYTPIAASLTKAEEVLAGHEDERNYVFLASDGEETCGGNTSLSVQALKTKFSDLTVDVAGLSVNATQRAQLEQIATLGGGKFYAVNSRNDWKNISTAFKNTFATADYQKCVSRVITAYTTCTMGEYSKAMNYINGSLLGSGGANYKDSINRVQNLSNQILEAQKLVKDGILNDADTFIRLAKPYLDLKSNL